MMMMIYNRRHKPGRSPGSRPSSSQETNSNESALISSSSSAARIFLFAYIQFSLIAIAVSLNPSDVKPAQAIQNERVDYITTTLKQPPPPPHQQQQQQHHVPLDFVVPNSASNSSNLDDGRAEVAWLINETNSLGTVWTSSGHQAANINDENDDILEWSSLQSKDEDDLGGLDDDNVDLGRSRAQHHENSTPLRYDNGMRGHDRKYTGILNNHHQLSAKGHRKVHEDLIKNGAVDGRDTYEAKLSDRVGKQPQQLETFSWGASRANEAPHSGASSSSSSSYGIHDFNTNFAGSSEDDAAADHQGAIASSQNEHDRHNMDVNKRRRAHRAGVKLMSLVELTGQRRVADPLPRSSSRSSYPGSSSSSSASFGRDSSLDRKNVDGAGKNDREVTDEGDKRDNNGNNNNHHHRGHDPKMVRSSKVDQDALAPSARSSAEANQRRFQLITGSGSSSSSSNDNDDADSQLDMKMEQNNYEHAKNKAVGRGPLDDAAKEAGRDEHLLQAADGDEQDDDDDDDEDEPDDDDRDHGEDDQAGDEHHQQQQQAEASLRARYRIDWKNTNENGNLEAHHKEEEEGDYNRGAGAHKLTGAKLERDHPVADWAAPKLSNPPRATAGEGEHLIKEEEQDTKETPTSISADTDDPNSRFNHLMESGLDYDRIQGGVASFETQPDSSLAIESTIDSKAAGPSQTIGPNTTNAKQNRQAKSMRMMMNDNNEDDGDDDGAGGGDSKRGQASGKRGRPIVPDLRPKSLDIVPLNKDSSKKVASLNPEQQQQQLESPGTGSLEHDALLLEDQELYQIEKGWREDSGAANQEESAEHQPEEADDDFGLGPGAEAATGATGPESGHSLHGDTDQGETRAPLLESYYVSRIRENERHINVTPRIRVLNQVEICDVRLSHINLPGSQWSSLNAFASKHQQSSEKSAKQLEANSRKLMLLLSLGDRHHAKGLSNKLHNKQGQYKNNYNHHHNNNANELAKSKPTANEDESLPFHVTYIDRIRGEITIEARDEHAINCERTQNNYTFKLNAIGCNGAVSNDAAVTILVEDVNEFGPEFEAPAYSFALTPEMVQAMQAKLENAKTSGAKGLESERAAADDNFASTSTTPGANWKHESKNDTDEIYLFTLLAHDSDCSSQFGSVCRYELIEESSPDSATAGGLGLQHQQQLKYHEQDGLLHHLVSQSKQQHGPESLTTPASRDSSHHQLNPLHFFRVDEPSGRLNLVNVTRLLQFNLNELSLNWNSNPNKYHPQPQPFQAAPQTTSAPEQAPATLSNHYGNNNNNNNETATTRAAESVQAAAPAGPSWSHTFNFRALAYDCAGRKSQQPASISIHWSRAPKCKPGLKDFDANLVYKPGSGARSPFGGARIDLCGLKCPRANVSVSIQLQARSNLPPATSNHQAGPPTAANSNNVNRFNQDGGNMGIISPTSLSQHLSNGNGGAVNNNSHNNHQQQHGPLTTTPQPPSQSNPVPPSFHCDRDSYSMVSKRRICGALSKSIELLPPTSSLKGWLGPLHGEPVINNEERQQQSRRHKRQQQPGASPTLLEPVEEENLAVYSPDGTYGRRALELLASGALDSSHDSGESQLASGANQTNGAKINNQYLDKRARHWQRQSAKLRRNSTTNASYVYPNGGASRIASVMTESASVYRDQIYRFDGSTGALVVPASVWQNSRELNSNINESYSRLNDFVFGAKQTISFWMRHSQQAQTKKQQEQTSTSLNDKKMPTNGVNEESEENFDSSVVDNEYIICATAPNVRYALAIEPDCRLVLKMRPLGSGARNMDTQEGQHKSKHRTHNDSPQDSSGGDSNWDSPIGWRWSMVRNEACDGKWHLYTLNVNYPDVELYLDGQQFEDSDQNVAMRIIEPATKMDAIQVDEPTLSIGGCVLRQPSDENISSGRKNLGSSSGAEEENEMGSIQATGLTFGLFRGQLSGLTVLAGLNDDLQTIECLGQCSESIISTANQMTGSGALQHDQQSHSDLHKEILHPNRNNLAISKPDNSLISYQESQSRIHLIGHDLEDIEEALGQIAYINKRQLPSIGQRYLLLETRIECASESADNDQGDTDSDSDSDTKGDTNAKHKLASTVINIDPVRVQIEVLPSRIIPSIILSGTTNLAREYNAFMQGFRPFASLVVKVRRIELWAANRTHRSLIKNNGNDKAASSTRRSWAHRSGQHHPTPTSTSTSPPSPLTNPTDYLLAHDYLDDPSEEDGQDQRQNNKQQHQRQRQHHIPMGHGIFNNGYKAPVSKEHGQGHKRVSYSNRTSWRRIEGCTLRISPPMQAGIEQIELPMDQINASRLYWRQSIHGFIIYGWDTAINYQRLLRAVVYRNERPALVRDRHFRLLCSDMNGRLVSNDYLQRVTVIHPLRNHLTSGDDDLIESSDSGPAGKQAGGLANKREQWETRHETAGGFTAALLRADPLTFSSLSEELSTQSDMSIGEKNTANANSRSSSKLDRIAIAFFVFVISLVVIMLIITLSDLRSSNNHHHQDSSSVVQNSCGKSKCGSGVYEDGEVKAMSSILYYDIDSNGQKGVSVGCYTRSNSVKINEDGDLDMELLDEYDEDDEFDNEPARLETCNAPPGARMLSHDNRDSDEEEDEDADADADVYESSKLAWDEDDEDEDEEEVDDDDRNDSDRDQESCSTCGSEQNYYEGLDEDVTIVVNPLQLDCATDAASDNVGVNERDSANQIEIVQELTGNCIRRRRSVMECDQLFDGVRPNRPTSFGGDVMEPVCIHQHSDSASQLACSSIYCSSACQSEFEAESDFDTDYAVTDCPDCKSSTSFTQ